MADVKISGLPASTVPLAGTEVLPIVQSGVTKQVANNDLRPKQIQSNATSGVLQVAGPAAAAIRVMTTPDANFTAARIDAAQSFTGDQTLSTGNLVIGTSGKGIDFSATAGTGTSELLNDYEEGTWTPTIGGLSSGSVTYFNQNATYTKVGNIVSVQFWLRINTATLPVSPSVTIEGLPYVSNADETRPSVLFRTSGLTGVTGVIGAWITQNTSALQLIIANNGGSGPVLGSNLANGAEFDATITYRVSS